jgi:hypothetical protein
MKKGAIAKRHRINTCKFCNNTFTCFDKKASICDSCREILTFNCACGCGKLVSRVRYKSVHNKYHLNHEKRGKTYKDIYGIDSPGCGFKRGLENVNYTKPKYKRFKYTNSIGEKFSSNLEVAFSEILIKNNIQYTTEVKIPMLQGKLKIVDFIIDNILVEVTGFAYNAWQQDFIQKIKTLRKSVNNPILIVTYNTNINDTTKFDILKRCANLDIFFESIDNESGILKKIRLFQMMEYTNSIIKKSDNTICNCHI